MIPSFAEPRLSARRGELRRALERGHAVDARALDDTE